MNKQKATLYFKSEMGGSVMRRELYLLNHTLTDYAQYKQVPQIDFILKGKRKGQRLIKGYKPFFLLLDGWNTPIYNDDEGFNVSNDGVMTIKESKYLSFDERYVTDFNRFINPLLKDNKIIADYRYNKEV